MPSGSGDAPEAKRRARVSRLFRSGRVLVPPDARFDYEAVELHQFAKMINFAAPGMGPASFRRTLAKGVFGKNGAIQGSYAGSFGGSFKGIYGDAFITKVVKALKHIEQKVEALVAAFGDEIQKYRALHPDRQQAGAVEDKSSDAALLNGPQMPDDAAKQAEIDALVAFINASED